MKKIVILSIFILHISLLSCDLSNESKLVGTWRSDKIEYYNWSATETELTISDNGNDTETYNYTISDDVLFIDRLDGITMYRM